MHASAVLSVETGWVLDHWPPQAPIRAVVFDVVGTLVEPHPPVPVAYRQAGLRQGIDLDLSSIHTRFGEAWRRQERFDAVGVPPFATSREREEDRWRQIVLDVFDHAPPRRRTSFATCGPTSDGANHGRPRPGPVGWSPMRRPLA